jgi:hypothetical protein
MSHDVDQLQCVLLFVLLLFLVNHDLAVNVTGPGALQCD